MWLAQRRPSRSVRIFRADRRALTAWIADEPSGAYARRAWFLFEWLTGDRLDLPDTRVGNYVPALDPARHYVVAVSQSRRHRVTDNLPGTRALCPLVRRTDRLEAFRAMDLSGAAHRIIAETDPDLLRRAVQYLYTKETRSTFALEREDVAGSRADRFVEALRKAGVADMASEAEQTRLCNLIIGDQRFHVTGWRTFQNHIGEAGRAPVDTVHCVFPRPENVRPLMHGLGTLSDRLRYASALADLAPVAPDRSIPKSTGRPDPVIAATAISFAFVFIHPFLDGNGRIHRFLIHSWLEGAGFTPPDMLFPVSAAILRNRAAYDAALEAFSRAIMPHVDWSWRDGPDGNPEVAVHNDTADLYRFFDATPQAEFLYARIEETIRTDLRQEIDHIAAYDRALTALNERSAMPDRMAALFVTLVLTQGRIGAEKRRRHFAALNDGEIDRLEALVRDAVADAADRG